MESNLALIEKQGRVGLITINRPRVMNALDIPTLEALEAAVNTLDADPEIRVIVFTGAGERAFVAGGDIADLETRRGLEHYLTFGEIIQRVFRRIETCDKPTIGAINGWALGGGTELLLTLDLRIVADDAELALPEILLGLFPGAGGSQRVMRQIPLCRAKELMFVGDRLDAREAVALGLCNRAVPRAQVLPEALQLAQRIAEKSPLVLKLLKRSLQHGADMPLGAALAYEHAMVGLAFDTEDAHEGCRAFVEKRKAQFKGE